MNLSLFVLVCGLPSALAVSVLRASPLDDVEKLIAEGKAGAAVEMMQREVKADEADPYRLYNFGLTLYRAGRYEEAINIFQTIDTTGSRELEAKTALQLGNIQFRLAQQLKKSASSPGVILSMERALGYFESANEIRAGKESRNNQKVAAAQLEEILVNVAEGTMANAQRLNGLNRIAEEEPLLRQALQALQRAGELNPGNGEIYPLVADATARLIANLDRQAGQLEMEAEAAKESKVVRTKREQAVAKYDDALALDPKNQKLTAARDEQLKKLSELLTVEAEQQSATALAKPELKLDARDQSNLEQAKAKLDEALSLHADNARAAELNRQIFQKLEESYVNQGNEGLKAADVAPAAQKKLDLVKNAADQFGKALAQNPQNQPAQEGLNKAEAQLPGLFAAAGQADLEKAKAMQSSEASSPGALSDADLKKGTALLDKAVQNLDTALSLQPGETSYQKSLEEAQKLLDAANDEANKRSLAKGGGQGENQDGGGKGESDPKELGEGKLLPLSLSNAGAKRPVTGDKFWNRKFRDW